jgi:hypothetical protein
LEKKNMNSIGALIATMDQDFLLLDKRQQNDLITAVVLYLFRVIESTELTDYFKELLNWRGQNCIDFRKVLMGKGYLQKNYKLYLYSLMCGMKPDADDFQIKEADVEFAKRLKAAKSGLAKRFSDYCKGRFRVGYKVRSIAELDRGLARVIPELRVTCGKYVTKQFKFLWQSGQMNRHELEQDLMMHGLYGQYRAYPEIDDLLHLKNIAITSIHNHGQNIIKEQTTKSRKRLQKQDDGSFTGTTLSINVTDFDMVFSQDSGRGAGGAMITCNAMMCSMDGSSCEYESPRDVERQRDLRLTIEGLLGRMKTERARQFTSILMGLHDAGFSKFLGEPNDEASDRMDRKDYAEKAREYLDIPKDKARGFMKKLREELVDYKT